MTLDWQVLLSVVILLMIVIAIWRGGQANPVGTRQILDRVSSIDRRVRTVETRSQETASRSAVLLLTERIEQLEQHTASSGEVLALSEKMNGLEGRLGAKIDAVEKAADRTEDAVMRIEGYFLQRGINGQ